MCSGGWIRLHRALLSSPVFENPTMLKVWVWCLLKASHSHHEQVVGLQKVPLNPGQFVTGRRSASVELGISESTFWRTAKTLAKCKNINIKSNNKYSVITVVKWEDFQNGSRNLDSNLDNRWTADGQQMDTNKNVKKGKNVKPKPSCDLAITDEGGFDAVKDCWNRVFGPTIVPNIREMTANRRTWFKREYGKQRERLQTLAGFEKFFVYLRDDCTCGESAWFSFDWLFKSKNNFVKAWEGNYDRKRFRKDGQRGNW